MKIFWISGIIVGALGDVGLLLYFVQTAVHVSRGLWRPNWRAVTWVEVLTLVFIGAYGCLLLLFSFGLSLFDRHLLVVVPALFVLVLVNEARSESIRVLRWRGVLSLALVVIYAAVSVAATHDYLAWNRSGVSPNQIEGGYEFNGWYLSNLKYKRVHNKMGWWVDNDEYIIASGPLSGYREVQRFDLQRWLPLADESVVVLHRVEPEAH